MDIHASALELKDTFERMGARLDVVRGDGNVDVVRDRRHERFVLRVDDDSVDRVHVRDLRVRERHLLLEMRLLVPDASLANDTRWRRFLCGHDEREWFAAAIPENRPVAKVLDAFDALKPREVRWTQARLGVPLSRRNRRRNEAFVRQGEWFFVPHRGEAIDEAYALRDEPLRRGTGKPHIAELCVRRGGELVYVHPDGRTRSAARHAEWKRSHRGATDPWRPMRRDPEVLVRGCVRHKDHATIRLDGWHRVFVNTEGSAVAQRMLAFLD